MEAFSLLRYWRSGDAFGGSGGGGGGRGGADSCASSAVPTQTATLVATALAQNALETDEEDDDDGPFFDLEFAVPEEDDSEDDDDEEEQKTHGDGGAGDEGEEEEEENQEVESDGEREFNFTLSSASSNDRAEANLSLSPSDDLFFKGKLVPIESSSLVLGGSETNSKHHFPASLLKSATKFRVFMLGLKKSKAHAAAEKAAEPGGSAVAATPKQKEETQTQEESKQSKLFTVKFKVEEVPIVSLFTRDHSSRNGTKPQKQSSDECSSDEKRFAKDVMQRYLKKVKPLYVRVSRRYGEKLRFSGQLNPGSGAKSQAENGEGKGPKQGNLPAGLRVVCKHLGKSRSASSAVAAAPPGPSSSRRRDDSLLQQQDGIQGAILHCKRSFNASRESSDSGVLPRCVSDPTHDKSVDLSRNTSQEV